VVEAVMLWNEPNNLSHWDFELDPDWAIFSRMVKEASQAITAENRSLVKVLGGISPIDPGFVQKLQKQDVIEHVDVVGVHGFPLDWNHWTIHEWPDKLSEIRAICDKPLWVTEAGVSSFGAEEVQEFGLRRAAELLLPEVDRVHWYSLLDLPRAWPATTRHREAEGSSYYRHFYMGLYREDFAPKLASRWFGDYTPSMGVCQWFHYEDERIDRSVELLRDLGVKRLRTGISWADYERPNSLAWFDYQMKVLQPFDLTITFCFTPEHKGLRSHHTSPPTNTLEYAEFCASMVRRYV